MKTIFYPAKERGIQDHGWLKAAHSFSFANYHDSAKVHFGLLRVLNDDIVAPGMGFGTHAHDNMEIVTIPLRGAIAHKDSLGSEGVIKPGEVQIMSAGRGIKHSEFNASSTEEMNTLQIWVFPKKRNIEPRYDQRSFDPETWQQKFLTLVSPKEQDDAMWINQDAFFSIGEFKSEARYQIQHPGNGAYLFMIEGEAEVEGRLLGSRDAVGISDTDSFDIQVSSYAKILIIDVPME